MSTPNSAMTTPPVTNGRADKVKKQKKIVVLNLPAAVLSRFLDKPSPKPAKSTPSPAPTPNAMIDDPPTMKESSSNDNQSEGNSTPAPLTDGQNGSDPSKKKKGLSSGMKRSLGFGIEGVPKPRGKPGPKKKPRLEDGTIDHTMKPGPGPPVAIIPGTKLGPRANQGAINAGLRALDRSGKPCRKWEKKAFQLKSFTGIHWEMSSWNAPKPELQNGEAENEINNSQRGSSEAKQNDSSTAMDSNPGDQIDPMTMSTPAASSPVAGPLAVTTNG